MENGKMKALKVKRNDQALRAGMAAPNFLVFDLDGKMYELSDLKGKTVVLNFWFTACAPCKQEMPELNKLIEKYKNDSDVVFLAITYDPADKVKDFLSKTSFTYPIATGQEGLTKQYGITGYPTNIVIDRNGIVTYLLSLYGPETVLQLDNAIVLAAKPR